LKCDKILNNSIMKIQVSKKFSELYGEGAILFASPGRINLIGEHTDYNGGFGLLSGFWNECFD